MGKGQELWKRAKRVIPGGNMLLSKRPEMFLPEQWPAYFSKAKGCRVWDLDGRELIDMTIMGVGANTLGYGDDRVDAAVLETVAKGNMSTLNAPEEVELAERLVALHPWAEMARFARTGGEANAVAIRIARAASGATASPSVAITAGTTGISPPISAPMTASPVTSCRGSIPKACRKTCVAPSSPLPSMTSPPSKRWSPLARSG